MSIHSNFTAADRFLNYVTYDTRSDTKSGTKPSSKGQIQLGSLLVKELHEIGIDNAEMDKYGYVYASIPATSGYEDVTPMGYIAHIDTAPDLSGSSVKARIIRNYSGGDILLNKDKNIIMKISEYNSLKNYIGQDLIVTDGTTLLGSDDKAGIAEIMAAAEKIKNDDDIKHGKISISFTPDEEIGCGSDRFSLEHFGAEYAYTVDGGKLGELEYENFNAASAIVKVHGVNTHTGEAKGRMKNSLLIANDFIGRMPSFETPSETSGREGFFHLLDISGNVALTELSYIIRDHDRFIFNGRKEFMKKLISKMNKKYGQGTFEINIADNYYNMKDMIMPHMWIIDKAKSAMEKCGVKPCIMPVRGGTDGARLSYMGLPCPNLSTGGHNFHEIFEYIPIQSMEKMTEILIQLARANLSDKVEKYE